MRAIIVVVALALAGCATKVETEVTRFHTAEMPRAATFAIQPEGPQAGSLEFQHYAAMVAERLGALGWRPAAGDADAVVHLRWGQGPQQTEEWSAFGNWPQSEAGIPTYPYYEAHKITSAPMWLTMEMLDGPRLRRGQRQVVFEGRAVAPRSDQDIFPVMPYLVNGLFANFPGPDAQTVKLDVAER